MTNNEKRNIYNNIQNLYNMDFKSWQEVLAMMYNLVADTSQKFEAFEQKFDLMLGSEVTKAIKELYENGSLAQIINSEVFKNLNSKINYLKDHIEKTRKEINEQLNNINSKINYNIINLLSYGIKPNDDISTIINQINESSVENKKQATIIIPFNCRLDNKIILDINYVKLKADNIVLNTNNIVDGEAILLTSSIQAPYNNTKNIINGVSIEHKTTSPINNTIGIKYHSTTGEVAHISIENSSISGYGKGELYMSSSYLVKHRNVNIFNCKECISIQNDIPINNAENISFESSSLFNSDIVVYNNFLDSDINFVNCSFDYNKKLFFNKGKINCTNCHFEGKALNDIQFVCEGYGTININNSFIVFHFPEHQNAQNNYIANVSEKSSLIIKSCYMTGTLNIYDKFSIGNGYIELSDISAPDTYVNNTIVNDNKNLIIDDNFSFSNIVDNISISKDTKIIDNRFDGDNLKITIDNNLIVEKIWGSGSDCAFSFYFPIRVGQWFDFKFNHKSDDGMTGQLNIDFYLANVKTFENGLHQVNKKEKMTTLEYFTQNDKSFISETMPTKIHNKKDIYNYIIIEFDMYYLNGLNKKIYLNNIFANTY